jgi:DNA-binding NtrC family response regulator
MTVHWLDSLLIGESFVMRQLRERILCVGGTDLAILIEGPTGSGKELVANALHIASGRRGTFVPFNVCAVTETMFEDALFGHVRGAFTGASFDSPGYLVESDGGTVFLDEIGGLPLGLQMKLLRAIETKSFRAVGARADRRSDFRVVSATNERVAELLALGRLREDLFERLAGVLLQVPPLRERVEDIPLLAEHFLASRSDGQRARLLTSGALRALMEYDWPRNVRQLKGAIERAIAFASGDMIGREEILLARDQMGGNGHGSADDFERRRLLTVLTECGGDTALAGERLGINRGTVYRRIEQMGIDLRSIRSMNADREPIPSTSAIRANSQSIRANPCEPPIVKNSKS